MKSMVINNRDVFFDSLKFFLISLVILGHIIEISENTRVGMALYNTLYSFHMPLFVFVSGFFSRKYEDNYVFFRKILRLVETYLIFQLIFNLPSILTGNIYAAIVRPWWVLWYLFSLITWRVILQITPPLLINNWKITICIVGVLSLLAGFLPLGYEFSFQRTFTFMPFFTIGYICANLKVYKIKSKLPSKIISLLYFVLVFIAFYYLDRSFSQILYGSVPYYNILGFYGRLIQLFLGCLWGVCFMGLIKDVRLPCFINLIGSNTMFFFIYHAFYIVALKELFKLSNIQLGLIHIVIVYLLIMLLLYLMSYVQFFHLLLNPISSLYDKKNTSSRRV